jgi:hypothetical protein
MEAIMPALPPQLFGVQWFYRDSMMLAFWKERWVSKCARLRARLNEEGFAKKQKPLFLAAALLKIHSTSF